MPTYTLKFKLAKTTPGALQYKESEVDGMPSDRSNQVIGTLYVRKSAATRSDGAIQQPSALTVTVAW